MSVKIRWNFTLQVEGRHSVNILGNDQVEAYDKASITIPNDNVKRKVKVQQPDKSGQLDFMVIESSQYDEPEKEAQPNLSYKILGDLGNHMVKLLDQTHILVGSSLISLLGKVPKEVAFRKNSTENEAKIEKCLLVVRPRLSEVNR